MSLFGFVTVIYFKTKLLKNCATICNVGHISHQNGHTNWLCYVFKTVCPICRTVCPICCELCPICHDLRFPFVPPNMFFTNLKSLEELRNQWRFFSFCPEISLQQKLSSPPASESMGGSLSVTDKIWRTEVGGWRTEVGGWRTKEKDGNIFF